MRRAREGDEKIVEEDVEERHSRIRNESDKADEEQAKKEADKWKREELWKGEERSKLWSGEEELRVCTWNVARALAWGAERGARSQEEAWGALLDWMVDAGVSILGLQEVGFGAKQGVQDSIKGVIRRWAKRRGRQAGIWLNSKPGKRLTQGGVGAGVAVIILGEWAARVQTVRRWKSG